MASQQLPSGGRRRGITAALLALLLFLCEQTLLAQSPESLLQASPDVVTVGAGLQWLLTLVVLAVTGSFFFAAVRGIRLRA